MADSTESIVYGEATRMVTEQRGVRDGLRIRAGTLLTAASLVTSFLGGVALSRYTDAHPHAGLTRLAWSGVGAFIAVVVLAVAVLAPWRWRFVVSPRILTEDHLGSTKTEPDELRKFLAVTLESYYDRNAKTLNRLFAAFVVASGLLVYEAIAWVLVLQRS